MALLAGASAHSLPVCGGEACPRWMEEKLTATLAWRPQLVQQILSQDVLLALDEFSCILDLPTISHCF